MMKFINVNGRNGRDERTGAGVDGESEEVAAHGPALRKSASCRIAEI
jgi:hypothetical protein